MQNNTKETLTIPFTTSATSEVIIYQRTPQVDEMFYAELMESTEYPITLWWNKTGSSNVSKHNFVDPYTGYNPDSVLMEAGVAYEFRLSATAVSASGSFSLSYTPALLTELRFDLPANSGTESRMLLTTFVPDNYATLRLALLKASELPLAVELTDSSGRVLGRSEFLSMMSSWYSDVTLELNTPYNLYVINTTASGSENSGYFDLNLYLTENDMVEYTLPAEIYPQNIYTRTPPADEYVEKVTLSSAIGLPVTLQINNGTTTVSHQFTAAGEFWSAGRDFYMPLHVPCAFTLTNDTTPSITANGQLDFIFVPTSVTQLS